jgi:flagellin
VSAVSAALAYVQNKAAYIASDGGSTGSTDTDVSAAVTSLAAAVKAYNGYDVATASANADSAVSSGSDGVANGNTTSALAVYNALDNGMYSDFSASGFGNNTAAIATTATSAYTSDSVNGTANTVSSKVAGMGAYAKALTQTKLLTGANVGVAASNDMKTTADETNAITVTANKSGVGGQISGFNISVSDSEGNVKKSVNASLDSWSETIRAQNKSDDNSISLHVGAAANQSIKVGLTDMRSEALGLKGADGTKLNISTQVKANAAVNVLDNAIQKALDQQTTIGSIESRLSYTSSNLTTASENVQASESTIRDADMAKEMTEYTKNNVLLQAAQSMLAQANQSSSSVLSLLQ